MRFIEQLLSRYAVLTRTAAGFAVLLMMMAGLALFSLVQMTEIRSDVHVLVELDDMDVSIASTYNQVARLNTLVHSFLRTREPQDIAAAQAESKALDQAVKNVFARFGKHPLLETHQPAIRSSLERHAKALNAAAEASHRHRMSANRFFTASIPIATTVYAMGVDSGKTDSERIEQAKRKLQAYYASSHSAVSRYVFTQQPIDAETAREQLRRFEELVNAQKAAGQAQFDEFVGYIRSKLPAYRDEAIAITEAVPLEAEAEIEINQATADLDRLLNQVKSASSEFRARTVVVQLHDMDTLNRSMLGVTGLAILIGSLLAWVIGRSITKPIGLMTEAMRNLSAGDLNVEIPALDHHDEIGRMAAATEIFKQNALALRESENRYRELLQNLVEGVMQTTPNGQFLSINQAMADILGWSSPMEMQAALTDIGRQLFVDSEQRDQMLRNIREKGAVRNLEVQFYRKDRTVITALLSVRGVMEQGELVRLDGTMADISERKIAEREIESLAFYDPLTQLPNRRLFQDRLRQSIVSRNRSGREAALLFIDLDDFKTLNDIFGHAEGDVYLQEVARRLRLCVRATDTVARFGGDEFVIILEDLSDDSEEAAGQTRGVGEKIQSALDQPFTLATREHHGTASIGATLFGKQRNNIDDLLKQADIAMFQAKAEGRNKLRFFDPELQVAVETRAVLEADLRRAIKQQQFFLYYQPQIDLDGIVIGAEALLRWQHPERGLVSPSEFIPIAEDTGLILPIGNWVLNTACTQLVAWASHPESEHLTLSVNISARQLHQADFVEQVSDVLDLTRVNPRRLKLELTESMLLDNISDVIEKMTTLKAKGVGFSLDDFGTGYSSLSNLKQLPLDQLKIDPSFVRDLLVDPHDGAIAQTIITLGQTLGLSVVAEGVENREQLDFLTSMGCSTFQGYLFSRPVPPEDFRLLLLDMPREWQGLHLV